MSHSVLETETVTCRFVLEPVLWKLGFQTSHVWFQVEAYHGAWGLETVLSHFVLESETVMSHFILKPETVMSPFTLETETAMSHFAMDPETVLCIFMLKPKTVISHFCQEQSCLILWPVRTALHYRFILLDVYVHICKQQSLCQRQKYKNVSMR